MAQAPTSPVIDPRGVLNAFTRLPAPATVARGGILHINGFNLGPPEGATASAPLPTTLGGAQALINGRAAPLFSVTPGRIAVQVPWDATVGLANIVVTRGNARSRPAHFTILAEQPSLRTANDSGYGVAGTMVGQTLSLTASGLGATDPAVDAGAVGTADPPVKPTAAISAYIGGIRTNATAALSAQRPGEFEVRVDVPAGARPGDAIALNVNAAGGALRPANGAIFQGMRAPDVQFVPLPEGTPDLRTLTSADLNGAYLVGTGARDAQGCFAAVLFDMARKTASKISDCLTAPNAAALPVVVPNEANVLGALIGPPAPGAAPGAAISSKAAILNPILSDPLLVDLPSPAASILQLNGGLAALIPGPPAQALPIDSQSGTIGDPINAGGPGGGVGGPLNFFLNVDGLTHVLTAPIQLPQGRIGLIAGDDADQPKRAKFVILNQARDAVSSKDFPDGWLPLMAPQALAGRPAGVAPRREPISFDSEGRVLYALARNTDNSRHGFIAFTLDSADPKTIPFPDGSFAAACSPAIPFFPLALSRRLAMVASTAPDIGFRNPCPGSGFVQIDLTDQSVSFIPLPGQGQLDASPAAGAGEINNFVYGLNTDSSRRGISDSLFVFDGVNASVFRLDLPTGVAGFQGLQEVPELTLLVGSAQNRVAGDAGLVLFDLENQAVRTIPIPSGFAAMNLVGVFPTTRKLVARGISTGNTGSQFLIYDLAGGDLTIAPNPEGVASVGQLPAAQGPGPGPPMPGGPPAAPARMLIPNLKANTVAAVGLDASNKQVGVMVVRIP